MAVRAYVLIEVATGKTKEVIKQLSKLDRVKSTNVIMGPYDVIAMIECPTYDALSKTCLTEIQTIKEVRHTMTCPIVDI
jgi:DNA-binding Lrp family transcriptional regulator